MGKGLLLRRYLGIVKELLEGKEKKGNQRDFLRTGLFVFFLEEKKGELYFILRSWT